MSALMVPDALAARLVRLALHRGLLVEELLGSLVEEAEDEDLAGMGGGVRTFLALALAAGSGLSN